MSTIMVEMVEVSSLKPWKKNAREHSRKQIDQVAASIAKFGLTFPLLIDGNNSILAGHARAQAAKKLGMKLVPCVRNDTMSEKEKRAYVIADNKIALNSRWNEDLLAEEFKALIADDFDLSTTGFSIPEIDSLIEGVNLSEPGDPAEDRLPALNETPRCRPGDLWQLGEHRLICGSALDRATVAALMDGNRAQMVFTDPPYNVPIIGHVGGLGAIQHREFAMASGEMSPTEFTRFLRTAFENLVAHSQEGAIAYIFMDWRHMPEILAAAQGVFSDLKNLIVWAKDNGGMGTFYRSRHELIFVFKKGVAPHINNFELGQHGRYRTNVWEYRGVSSMHAGRLEELALHPTVKPVQMIADAIKDVSKRGAIVLDLFGGSGSTIIAAHKTGRRAFVCEIDPVYCDGTIRRWEAFAHDTAELLACGLDVASRRNTEGA